MPTFEAQQPQENPDQKIKYLDNERELDENEVDSSLDDQYVFTFVVDRSGSMSGTKMNITKEAMKLFVQSLPMGSQFQIVSFGSSYQNLKNYQTNTWLFDFTNENIEWTKNEISNMGADFGGTEIYQPL